MANFILSSLIYKLKYILYFLQAGYVTLLGRIRRLSSCVQLELVLQHVYIW